MVDLQRNSRLGDLSCTRVGQHSLEQVYSTGTATRRRSDFDTVNVTWQMVVF